MEDIGNQQAELDALNRHMNLLSIQNNELSAELEKFLEADRVVQKNLNRRDKVDSIRSKVDEAIKKSMREVESRRSPERNYRRE